MLLVVGAAYTPSAIAQSPETVSVGSLPANLTREEVRELVARLSDAEVRELIIQQLDKQAASGSADADAMVYVGQLREGIDVAWHSLMQMLTAGDRVRALPGSIWRQMTEEGRVSGAYLLFQLIGLLAAGWIAEWLARRWLRRAPPATQADDRFARRIGRACLGAALGLAELGAWAAGAFLFIAITGGQAPAAQAFWHELIVCILLIKLVLLAVREVAAPGQPESRLVDVSENAARQAWAWALILMAALLLPQPLIQIVNDYGADAETDLLLRVVFSGIFFLLVAVLVVRLRGYGARLIAGDGVDVGSGRALLARIWWILTIAYLLVIWLMAMGRRAATGESSFVPGIGSLLLFVLIPFFDAGLKRLIIYYFDIGPEDETNAESPGESANDAAAKESATAENAEPVGESKELQPEQVQDFSSGYTATALRYARILMALAIVAIFVRLWNIDVEAIAAQLVGARFAGALFDIGLTVLLAWALWGVIRISIERKLADEKGPETATEEAEAGGLGGTRLETVLPLIRASIQITLVIMVVMISLSSLGVNIGPLLAGAGVVGLAIGFGAQTLVRDIVSGLFYLIDDAFRIGEYVVIDQVRGTVEKISIRSFQLRHHNGPVHTVPYGEIRTLTNWSRDWAIMKCELRVPFETDIEKVRKLIKRIGIEMMEDPQWGPLMLAPVKSQGVNRMDDSALIIRFKFTAVPGQQYLIRREAYTRIQREFEKQGIKFAPRRVLVEATTPKEAVQAAAGAIDRDNEGQAPAKDEP